MNSIDPDNQPFENDPDDLALAIGRKLSALEKNRGKERGCGRLKSLWRSVAYRWHLSRLFIKLDGIAPSSVRKQVERLTADSLDTLALAAEFLPIRQLFASQYRAAALIRRKREEGQK